MALNNVDDSEEMLAVWDKWSQQSSRWEEGACKKKWERFKGANSGGSSLTLGSLISMARVQSEDKTLFSQEKNAQEFQAGVNNVREILGQSKPADAPVTQPKKDDLPPIDVNFGINETDTKLPDELWEGIIHQSQKMFLSGPSKANKSWAAIALGASVAAGKPYWGRKTFQTKVLYLNFEIDKRFFERQRVNPIMKALKITQAEVAGYWDVWNLRGHASDAGTIIPKIIERVKNGGYGLIIIDPFYKLLGDGDENSARDIAAACNAFERLAQVTGACVIIIHHYAKGSASNKSTMDRGSGSGVFARDPDTHLFLTPHAEEDAWVVEGIFRNHPKADPFCLRWEYPILRVDDELDSSQLQGRTAPKTLSMEELLNELSTEKMTKGQLQEKLMELTDCGVRGFRETLTKSLQSGLVREGHTISTGGRPKKVFEVTEMGMTHLQQGGKP
jgi:hypothetical protein